MDSGLVPKGPVDMKPSDLEGLHVGVCVCAYTYGWLSKLWSFLGYPKYLGPYYNRNPKRDHNFDNHPYIYIYTYIYTIWAIV